MFCYFSNANKTDILQILNKGEIKIEKRETVKKKKEKNVSISQRLALKYFKQYYICYESSVTIFKNNSPM